MNENRKKVKTRKKGKKYHVRTHRKVLFFLLSLGIAGIFIGIVLSGMAIIRGQLKLLMMGLIYIAIFVAVLFVRSAIIQYDSFRKRRYAAGR